MKIKLICIVLMFALALNLSACGNSPEKMNNSGNESAIDALQSEKEIASDSVNNLDISGKVSGCYYANDNMVIVAADKLYLYDTQKGASIASVDMLLQDLYVQTYADGYFVAGQGRDSGGITGYLLNKEFEIENTISFDGLLSDDSVIGAEAAAVSQDGKNIAFCGWQGLYLYDISAQKLDTLLNYSEDGAANDMRISFMKSLTFTGDKTLVYAGTGISSLDGQDEDSIYGTVSIDDGTFSIIRKADYEIEGIQKGGDLLIMPQSFNKNNGTLLMFDTAANTEKTMTFSSGSEGNDGVFCSEQGKYVAVPTLGEDSVTINIYDTASGKVIHTEVVKDSDSTYFLRIPQILILEESDTCIVLLGRGISEVKTLFRTFGFEG